MKGIRERQFYGDREARALLGDRMSEQPRCLTCGKYYYKNYPEAKDGCKCDPEKRRILGEVH